MKKIFLVEDEWVHAEDIRITVEELGYQWLGCASEGLDALEKIRVLQPDIVLIDLNLHGSFSGTLIASQLKKDFCLPFIFVTAYLDEEVIRKCIDLSPVAYLHKPVNKGDLKAALIKAGYYHAAAESGDVTPSDTGFKLLIRVGNNLKPLLYEDITTIRTDAKNYVRIFSNQEAQYAVRCSLSTLEKWLPAAQFMRVHKEYIINLKYITAVSEANQTIQIGKLAVPLGRNFRSRFFSRYTIL